MEPILSAIASDLLSRALSMVIQRCMRSKAEDMEHKLQRLQRVLLRIDATVEDAEGRHITNQAMVRQLAILRQGMYCGHYMLDTFRCRGHVGDDDEVMSGDRAASAALPGFSSAKRLLFSRVSSDDRENPQGAVLDAEKLKKLDKIVGDLELMVADMVEFTLFLEGYPRIGRQPYSTYLILDKVMFGRQMEKEMIINFLFRPEAAGGDGNPGVLPIVGAVRVGKSTLVENICLDERVRGHFSLIVCFTCEDLVAGNMAALGRSGVIKHQDLAGPSRGRPSLAVIEVSGDVEEETWRRLYSSVASSMGHGSKIIVTSRSDKILALGTTQATIRLEVLPQEAYWYFFKALAFGSADPDDQPKLTSLGMEIAALLKGAFLGANIVGGMLRTNQTIQFWRRMLQCLRNFTSKHLLSFGEHPTDLIQKGHSVCIWRLARTQNDVVICNVYEKRSLQHDVPGLTAHDILTGNATGQGKFRMVAWTSKIPPYYTYMATCASLKVICSSVSNKKRPRQARI